MERLTAGRGHSQALASFLPALAVLAAIPGTIAVLALLLAADERRQTAALSVAAAERIAAIAVQRRDAGRRAALAPYLGAPTLAGALGDVSAILPPEAVLHEISREAGGVARIEVDCPDPDALLQALRARAPRARWRSVAQSMREGSGIRVVLEAAA